MPEPRPDVPDSPTLTFHLYVVGDNPRSHRAIENLRRIVDEGLSGPCEVEVIDVLEHPDRAEHERILATPTLIKYAPAPQRRITGDLSDAARVLHAIGVYPTRKPPEAPA